MRHCFETLVFRSFEALFGNWGVVLKARKDRIRCQNSSKICEKQSQIWKEREKMAQETCFLLWGATKGWPKSQGIAREQSSQNHQIYYRKRRPSNTPQKKETIKYTTEKGNHQVAVS